MNAGTTTLLDRPETPAASTVLAQARADRAAEWAELHQVDDLDDDACTLVSEHGEDTGIPVAGPGAPLVSEFAVIELATPSA